jgi:hypothetical protein
VAGIQTARRATRLNTTGIVTTTAGPSFDAEEEAGDETGESEGRADTDNDADEG